MKSNIKRDVAMYINSNLEKLLGKEIEYMTMVSECTQLRVFFNQVRLLAVTPA